MGQEWKMQTRADQIRQRRFADRIEKRWAKHELSMKNTEDTAILDLRIEDKDEWQLGWIEVKHSKHGFGDYEWYFIAKSKWDELVRETTICNQKCFLAVSFGCGTEAFADVTEVNGYGRIKVWGRTDRPEMNVITDYQCCVFIPQKLFRKFKGKVKPWNKN